MDILCCQKNPVRLDDYIGEGSSKRRHRHQQLFLTITGMRPDNVRQDCKKSNILSEFSNRPECQRASMAESCIFHEPFLVSLVLASHQRSPA